MGLIAGTVGGLFLTGACDSGEQSEEKPPSVVQMPPQANSTTLNCQPTSRQREFWYLSGREANPLPSSPKESAPFATLIMRVMQRTTSFSFSITPAVWSDGHVSVELGDSPALHLPNNRERIEMTSKQLGIAVLFGRGNSKDPAIAAKVAEQQKATGYPDKPRTVIRVGCLATHSVKSRSPIPD